MLVAATFPLCEIYEPRFDELSSALRSTEQRWHRTPSAHFPTRKLDQNFERTPRRATLQSSLRTTAGPLFHIDPFLTPVSNRSVYRTPPSGATPPPHLAMPF
jgi:hypothetical protein